MIYYVVLTIHVLVCLMLIVLILVQGGRGGLGEALAGSGSQSLFGGGTPTFIAKITAVGGATFLVTCLLLAKLSAEKGRSIIELVPPAMPGALAPAVTGSGTVAQDTAVVQDDMDIQPEASTPSPNSESPAAGETVEPAIQPVQDPAPQPAP